MAATAIPGRGQYELGTIDGVWYVWNDRDLNPQRAATIYEIAMWREIRAARDADHQRRLAASAEKQRRRVSFRGYLRFLRKPGEDDVKWPFELRLWNGIMQVVHHRRLPVGGVGTPEHGEHHRYWINLRDPLGSNMCWWCGQRSCPSFLARGLPVRWLLPKRRITR